MRQQFYTTKTSKSGEETPRIQSVKNNNSVGKSKDSTTHIFMNLRSTVTSNHAKSKSYICFLDTFSSSLNIIIIILLFACSYLIFKIYIETKIDSTISELKQNYLVSKPKEKAVGKESVSKGTNHSCSSNTLANDTSFDISTTKLYKSHFENTTCGQNNTTAEDKEDYQILSLLHKNL